MSFQEALGHQSLCVRLWLDWLVFGSLALPLALLIWRQSRLPAVAAVVAGMAGAFGVGWLYGQMGYVKLLGLPHIIFWTPLAIYLFMQLRRVDLPLWPRRIMIVVLATVVISLAFDYADSIRYFFGERTPTFLPAA